MSGCSQDWAWLELVLCKELVYKEDNAPKDMSATDSFDMFISYYEYCCWPSLTFYPFRMCCSLSKCQSEWHPSWMRYDYLYFEAMYSCHHTMSGWTIRYVTDCHIQHWHIQPQSWSYKDAHAHMPLTCCVCLPRNSLCKSSTNTHYSYIRLLWWWTKHLVLSFCVCLGFLWLHTKNNESCHHLLSLS